VRAILGTKLGMSQIFDKDGQLIPVTVIEAGPCTVVEKRTKEKHGYCAIQLGYGFIKDKRVNKPVKGYFKKKGLTPVKYLREVRVDSDPGLSTGDVVKADIFKPGDLVNVTGRSIGKGFAGSIKRWNFRRGPMAHGSKYHRGPGSLQSRDASRVFPGRKLPGHLGDEKVTVKKLEVVKVDSEKNLLMVRGGVPGTRGSLVIIKEVSQ
jgi:large subunit ribosomal protein L3